MNVDVPVTLKAGEPGRDQGLLEFAVAETRMPRLFSLRLGQYALANLKTESVPSSSVPDMVGFDVPHKLVGSLLVGSLIVSHK